MIVVIRFGTSKHFFEKTTNCTRSTGSCNYLGFEKKKEGIQRKFHLKYCDQ